jgi:NitT/TauT family transport system substrate-binding protein
LLWALFSMSSAAAETTSPAKVRFVPQWVPQAQFAGYYVALERGLYRHSDLDLTILRGGPDRPPSECLEKGGADFAVMFLSTGIVKRARGLRIVNLAQMVQRSALMLVAKKSSGILSPEDLQGKKIGLWGEDFRVQPRAFFSKYGLSVEMVPQSTTLNLFLRGGVDAASAMWYNEYHMILNAGLDPDELTTFFLADHGMNFPEDGIYCTEETFRKNPGLCVRFVKASVEGWKYAFAHPEEALDIVMKYVNEANVATSRVHQEWMLGRMKDIMLPPRQDIPMGRLLETSYDHVALELERNGMIDRVPSFSQFHVSCVSDAEK